MVALFGIKREDIFFKNNLEPLKVKQKVKKGPPPLPSSVNKGKDYCFILVNKTYPELETEDGREKSTINSELKLLNV